MKKPFKIISHSKRRKPHVLGRYATRSAADQAMLIFQRRHGRTKELVRLMPSSAIEDLYGDLAIINPEDVK